ncbi:MAG: VWA domain-containing protein, partial [Clostridia bacterium]|nr:VWA domain-containing protein [Deltaproteobacteria bacterium]
MLSLRGTACFSVTIISVTLLGCQDYTFAYREAQRIEAQRVNQVVARLTPVDVLFMIDNSPTMREETEALKNNIERFVTALADQQVDFQLGIVTPDVECNSPARVCSGPSAASYACCGQGRTLCLEKDNNGDGVIETSDCELGRLQGASAGGTRIFTAPAEADKGSFVQDVIRAITFSSHGLVGSSFESGLQAAALAVACSIGDPACSDEATGNATAAKALNAGFIRENADLVVLFLTDEDDCSTGNPRSYRAPDNASSPSDQANHFCSPDECYAYYNEGVDRDADGLDDWSDPTNGLSSDRRLRCGQSGTVERSVNPPKLAGLDTFIDQLTQYKGSIGKVRAAGIISAVQRAANVAYQGDACILATNGPSAECGCTAAANNFSCDVTGANGQSSTRSPLRSDPANGQVSPLFSGCT